MWGVITRNDVITKNVALAVITWDDGVITWNVVAVITWNADVSLDSRYPVGVITQSFLTRSLPCHLLAP